MAGESRTAVIAAIAGNLAVAVTKFTAAAITGSSAMLAEAIHSTVDTSDGLLLFLGMKLSSKPPDELHPFGHGKDLYFWSLVVAMMIFAVGGGITAYEGLLRILNPRPAENPMWNYIVLGCAAVFEGASLGIGFHQFGKARGRKPFWRAVRQTKDPTTFVVVFEDSAAILGLVVAFLGVWLGEVYHAPMLEGVASIMIGLILAVVAFLLGRECRSLLVGEGADSNTLKRVRELVRIDDRIEAVSDPLTMYFGPHHIMLALSVEFRDDLNFGDIEGAVDEMETRIRGEFPDIKRIFVEADSLRHSRAR